MSNRKQAQEYLQELSAFIGLASTDPSHAPTMSESARMAMINAIAPFLDDPQPSPDEAQVEEWIRETVDAMIGKCDDSFQAHMRNILRERLPAILGRGK